MRLQPKPLRKYPWYLRPVFRAQRRKYGAPLEAALLWARSPMLYMALSLLYALVDRRASPIPAAVRSLLMVRISQINHCPFCIDLNSAILLERGADPDKIEQLQEWRSSPLYDETERLALEYAEAMTGAGRNVDDGLFGRLQNRFDDDAIVELTALVAFQNLSSKFNSALDVPPQGLCRLPSVIKTAQPKTNGAL